MSGSGELAADLCAEPVLVRDIAESQQAWEDYIREHPAAHLYHQLAFRRVIEDTFGHRCHYRVAWEGKHVRGVLPLVEMKSLVFGHFLVSLPFFNYGGIVDSNAAARHALLADAEQLARRLRVEHIELRQGGQMDIGWQCRTHKVAMVVPLSPDPEEPFQRLSSRLRGKIRKAERAGAVFSVQGEEGSACFYEVFARNMRDLGTPVYPRRLFRTVLEHCRQFSRVFLVHLRGQPVAAAIGLQHGRTMELAWICSRYDYSRHNVNEFLYWSTIAWACRQGIEWLDLGRSSKDSGPYRFKVQWRPEERRLSWYYWIAPGSSMPRLSPDNPKFSLAVSLWKRLPLAAANFLGPRIVRNIP